MDAYPPVDLSRLRKRRWRWLAVWIAVGLVLALGGYALLIPSVESIKWVGHKELDIRFVVTNAETGAPVGGAKVLIHQEGRGFGENCQETKDFTLTTGPDGTVLFHCGKSMCFGTKNQWQDTFAIHLPEWYFSTSATGYFGDEWTDLDEGERRQQVQRGDKVATLDVPIRLRPAARLAVPPEP